MENMNLDFMGMLGEALDNEKNFRHIIVSGIENDNFDVRRLCHYFPALAKKIGIEFHRDLSKRLIPHMDDWNLCGVQPMARPTGLVFTMRDKFKDKKMENKISNEKFTMFWNGPFSQWYNAPFVLHGLKFNYAETYMMWCKDQLFSGGKLASEIFEADQMNDPREVKKLGRRVENFDKRMWESVAKIFVFTANMAKFTQNSDLKQIILDTAGTTLVEASPLDEIWGIGLSEDDPEAYDRATWNGLNWLGETLTEVRETIILASKT